VSVNAFSRPRLRLDLGSLGVLAALLLAVVASDCTPAATPSKIVVNSTSGQPNAGLPQLWTGTIDRDGPRIAGVPECQTYSCDHLLLQVMLPNRIWDQQPGGILVAVRFIRGTPHDNLALAVYRDDVRVAASKAQAGTAQSIVLRSAQNGVYDVYVVDGISVFDTQPSPSISYEGLSQVVYDSAGLPIRDLLPDLVALPQQNVTFRRSMTIFNDTVAAGSSCFESEIAERGAHTCLRFDQVLANAGAGPLELRFDVPTGTVPTNGQQFPVSQRIYRSDGTFHDVPAGFVLWHASHQHYHFNAFAQSKLWAVDANGTRAGITPVAIGDKVSFCIATTDINPTYWRHQAVGPDAYPAPDCLFPASISDGFKHFTQGMSVGWADTYDWYLPSQYVEVTGVPDGDYVLDTTVDPTNRLMESDKTNNCGSVRVRLSSMGTPKPQAQLLGIGPACPS
jgi:lysyl oxidase